MGGWSCEDRETNHWDGTLSAKTMSAGTFNISNSDIDFSQDITFTGNVTFSGLVNAVHMYPGSIDFNTSTGVSFNLDGGFYFQDSDASHSYGFAVSNLTADRTITLPAMTADGNMVIDSFLNKFTATQTIDVQASSSSSGLTINIDDGDDNIITKVNGTQCATFGDVLGLGITGIKTPSGGISFFAAPDGSAYMAVNDAANDVTIAGGSFTCSSTNIGFFGATPVAQPTSTGEATGYTGGGGTALTHTDTFTGNSGTKAYTINDIVKHLKALGLLDTS